MLLSPLSCETIVCFSSGTVLLSSCYAPHEQANRDAMAPLHTSLPTQPDTSEA